MKRNLKERAMKLKAVKMKRVKVFSYEFSIVFAIIFLYQFHIWRFVYFYSVPPDLFWQYRYIGYFSTSVIDDYTPAIQKLSLWKKKERILLVGFASFFMIFDEFYKFFKEKHTSFPESFFKRQRKGKKFCWQHRQVFSYFHSGNLGWSGIHDI